MNGLRDDLRERILVANPHLRVLTFGAGLRMDDWRKVLEIVRKQPGVVAAAPEVISQAGITAGQDYGEGVNLVGFDPDTGTRSVTSLPQSIQQGDLSFRTTKPDVDGGILLGARLANRLSVYPGDVVTLVPVTQAKVNPALGVAVPRFWRFEVTGLFDTGMFQYDNQFVVRPAGRGAAVHRAGRRGVGHRGPGGRSRPGARRSARRWRSGWATPTAPSTGRPRTPACSAPSSSRSWPWD